MEQKVKLWVRDVEEYFFCPMVFYFSVVLGISKNEGYWAELGKEFRREPSIQFQNLSKFKLRNLGSKAKDLE